MGSFFRRHHPAVVAYLALFVALGGSSYAAIKIGSAQIVDNSVRSKDIRNNEIRSADVRNGGLRALDFKSGELPAGPKGDRGLTGPHGDTGAPGISGLELISTSSGPQDSNSPKTATATCSAGKRVIGASGEIQGGATGSDPNAQTDVHIDEVVPTGPDSVPGSVGVQAFEDKATAVTWSVTAHAICANVG